MAPSSRTPPNLGQVIEYLPGRLYLASYLHKPTADTFFPYGDYAAVKTPSKRGHRSAASESGTSSSRHSAKEPYYFTVDDTLLYNAFHHDFGPLHVGHLYRFALHFHDVLAATEAQQRPVVFWSQADPRSRANASCMLACYMVLIQSWPPHLALAPIAQVDPPLMPFRDAGYSQADYGLTVQDVVYGVWKAKEEGCCVLDNFDLAEYEQFERVEHGDFNWITPHFLAFASPQHTPVSRITEESELYATLPRTLDAVDAHPTLPLPFKNVLRHFSERNIGLVVRLNSPLYSPSYFEALGIQHLDMIFEDGTCPPMSTVRKFVRLAHEMITVRKKSIAVHCKAGLGRTGCLIGAYLIYRHGFSANEIIAFMRFMRPGMVVGPQQHWLHINQNIFREWWVEERLERRLRREYAASTAAAVAAATAAATASASSVSASAAGNGNSNIPSTPIRAMQKTSLGRSSQPHGSTSTPPNRSFSGRSPLSEMDQERTNVPQEDYLPAPTPGQPRKTARADRDRHHPYARSKAVAASYTATVHEEEYVEEEDGRVKVGASVAQMVEVAVDEQDAEPFAVYESAKEETSAQPQQRQQAQRISQGTDSEEELHLRMRMHRKAAAAAASSPDAASSAAASSGGTAAGRRPRAAKATRSASHTTMSTSTTATTMTTTTTTTLSSASSYSECAMDCNDASNDAENIGASLGSRVKAAVMEQRSASTSGAAVLAKVRGSEQQRHASLSSKRAVGGQPAGIRKTSGRVGSVGAIPTTTAAMLASARKVSGLQ